MTSVSVFKGVSKLMRPIREFRLPTTRPRPRTTSRKSESLFADDQSFNVNNNFSPATEKRKIVAKFPLVFGRLNATAFRRKYPIFYFSNDRVILIAGLINNRSRLERYALNGWPAGRPSD